MTTTTLTDVRDLVSLTEDGERSIFRGVTNSAHTLVPSVGRNVLPENLQELLTRERTAFSLFRIQGAPYLDRSDYTLVDLLAVGQHHGLRTRLMDWTLSPLVGIYFAAYKDFEIDGCLYSCPGTGTLLGEAEDPLAVDSDLWVVPRHISPRIAAQSGLFSLQKDPTKEFTKPDMKRFIIPAKMKHSFMRVLHKWGMHEASLFPGLDGVAANLNKGILHRLDKSLNPPAKA